MTMMIIDTHSFVKRLREVEADEKLAEAIVNGVSETMGE